MYGKRFQLPLSILLACGDARARGELSAVITVAGY
jgi:hypothetical protein